MKAINNQLVETIKSVIEKGINTFESRSEVNSLSDIYLFFDEENAVLTVYDDMENILSEKELEDFSELESVSHEEEIVAAAKMAVEKLEKESFFEKGFIYKPFSISLTDSDFIVSEELLFLDDELLKLDDGLLSDLDKDLNNFLQDLMKI